MTLSHKASNISLSILLTICISSISVFSQTEQKQIAKNQPVKKDGIVVDNFIPKSSEDIRLENITISNKYLNRVGVNSYQTKSLTLNQAIRLALNNNNDIEIARDDVKIAELSLRSLLGNYDGVFSFTPTYDRNARNGQASTKDISVNSDFNKQIKNGGGNYRVFLNSTRTENAFAQAQATQGNIGGAGGNSALNFTSLGVTYIQPLLRNFRVDNTRRQIKIQQKRIAQSDADFRRRTIEVISQVQRAYWDLVFALRDQQNRAANLNLTKENLRQVEARIAAGSAAPLQKAEVSTELANRESEVLLASQQVSIAENTLKQLLLKDSNASEWSESFVPTDSPVINLEPILLNNAIDDAVKNRPELSRLKLEKEVNDIDVEFFKNQTKARIDLTSTFSLDGLASSGNANAQGFNVPLIFGDPATNANAFLLSQIQALNDNPLINGGTITPPNVFVPSTPGFLVGGYSQSFRNIFRNDARNFTVGVTISFPFRNKTAKANLASAKIQEQRIDALTRQQEQSIITEVRNAVQAVTTAQQRVLTARRARANAEIQLEGEIKLYNAGRSTIFLRFQRENALTNARNAEIRAETDYNIALSDLQRATSTTLNLNNVEVENPSTSNEIKENDN